MGTIVVVGWQRDGYGRWMIRHDYLGDGWMDGSLFSCYVPFDACDGYFT